MKEEGRRKKEEGRRKNYSFLSNSFSGFPTNLCFLSI